MDPFRKRKVLRMKADISVHLLFTKQRILSYISWTKNKNTILIFSAGDCGGMNNAT